MPKLVDDRVPDRERTDGERITGRGWFIQCPACRRSYLVTREEIMSGTWLTKSCPHCAAAEDGEEAA